MKIVAVRRFALLGAVVAVAACGSGGLDSRPERVAQGREILFFNSVEEMVATSELVVKGHVVSVKPGRWLGAPGAKDADQIRDLTVAVDEVLFAKGAASASTIHVDELGWDNRGRGHQSRTSPGWTKGQ